MLKAIALSFLCLLIPASAIVVQDYATAEAPPSAAGQSLDWSHVHHYKGSSAVAVAAHWILTAAHVADDGGSGSLSIDGSTYTQQEIVFHSLADLALVRYDKALPGYYSLYTGNLLPHGADPKLSVVMVGYGTKGNVFPNYWTDSGLGRGTRRWGSQMIDSTATKIYDSTASDGFWMDFNPGNTTNEAGVGVGDSGGGTFYKDDGVWKLAGINTIRAVYLGHTSRWDSSFSVSMPDYADWITETIPEPVAMSLTGLGMIGLFLSRAKQRRKLPGNSMFPVRHEPLCDAFFDQQERKAGFGIISRLIGLQRAVKARLHPAMCSVYSRYRELEKIFWNRMVLAHERKMARRQVTKAALKRRALNSLDSFLARVMK